MGLFENGSIYKEFVSPYQMIGLCRDADSDGPIVLRLNGEWQFNSRTEYVYHESIVHPAMAVPTSRRVFIAGGGDGFALREVLKWTDLDSIELCELDQKMIDLFSKEEELIAINRGSLLNPRVKVTVGDAKRRIRELQPGSIDVLIMDYPSPREGNPLMREVNKLFQAEEIEAACRVLGKYGVLVLMGSIGNRNSIMVVGSLLGRKWNVWSFDSYYTSDSSDTFIYSSCKYPKKFRELPKDLRFITPRHVELAYSEATELREIHLEYAAEFMVPYHE